MPRAHVDVLATSLTPWVARDSSLLNRCDTEQTAVIKAEGRLLHVRCNRPARGVPRFERSRRDGVHMGTLTTCGESAFAKSGRDASIRQPSRLTPISRGERWPPRATLSVSVKLRGPLTTLLIRVTRCLTM
ncbi:hypothetical protein SKAU_G00165330 [Synaphobranchus kaupii]|uniref:Uncharacterized protein n=1 Tax=Synaphobranchus kaupii TaxID=118154 RepID=A0A9Q1FJB1_SYNKA|nr:hypothetical protein SKAU_G00165330 [Synaphobranchus kaupii]